MPRNEARFRATERRLWEAFELSPTEVWVRLPGGCSLRVQEVGDGPPVLFVHGASNGGASWASLLAHLPDARCLLIDRPGCGLSEPVSHSAGRRRRFAELEHLADRLLGDVLDALDLPAAVLVATSFGGYFAFRGAAARPERVVRLVELGWTVGAPMERVPVAMRLAATPALGSALCRLPPTRGGVKLLLRQIGLRGALDSGRFTDVMLDWYWSLLRDTPTARNDQRLSRGVIRPVGGLDERMLLTDTLLGEVTMPVHLVWGVDDPNGGPVVARQFAERLPNATLELLPETGHAPWVDEPQRCAALLRTLLSS